MDGVVLGLVGSSCGGSGKGGGLLSIISHHVQWLICRAVMMNMTVRRSLQFKGNSKQVEHHQCSHVRLVVFARH